MATIHHSHHRTPSAGHKFVLRPTGSTPHPLLITKNHSSGKLASKGKASHANRKSADEESLADDFENMAMSFHQYCTTCEKMISVPDFAILYCSESCRRRDGTISPPSPPILSEYEAFTKRPALSRRKLQPAPTAAAATLPAVQHEGTPDMDPTEWKPDGSRLSASGAGASSSSTVPRRPSEAFLYLSQFHRSSDSLVSSSSRRRKAQKNVGGATGNAFSLTPAGSNDSSAAGSPIGSASAGTAGTAPSVTYERASDSDDDEKKMLEGIGFAKKQVAAREEVSSSLGKLLAASGEA